jgi:hypothetical protein
MTINPFYKFAWPGFLKLRADDKLTVACLVAVCDNETLKCAVSTRYVSEWTRLSRAQVFKCLHRLTLLHVIKKIAVVEGVGFGCSRFQLNPVFNIQPPDRSQIGQRAIGCMGPVSNRDSGVEGSLYWRHPSP